MDSVVNTFFDWEKNDWNAIITLINLPDLKNIHILKMHNYLDFQLNFETTNYTIIFQKVEGYNNYDINISREGIDIYKLRILTTEELISQIPKIVRTNVPDNFIETKLGHNQWKWELDR